MTLFNTTNTFTETNVTAIDAQAIYVLLKTKNSSDIRREDNYRMFNIEQVQAEIKKLESEMVSKMNGSYVTVEEVSHIDEESGETVIDTPVEYFSVTTETALKESMSSDILDVDTLVEDVRKWSDNNPDSAPTFSVYKNSFNQEE